MFLFVWNKKLFLHLEVKEKNGVILTKKVESLAELKFDPGFRVIGEYLSQIDSILRVNSKIDIVN